MRDVEQLLRDELSRRSGLPGPPAATVLSGVHGRRRRRRVATTVALGALAVVVTTVGTVAALRPAAAPVPPAVPPAPAGQLIPVDPGAIRFADADHGYALAKTCPPSPCDTVLAATDDGGATWRRQAVPRSVPQDQGLPSVTMRVLDAERVALDDFNGERRWFTVDGGRTWSELSTEPQGTVAEIPVGALAEQRPHPEPLRPAQIVVLRSDGTSALLDTPPAAPHPTVLNTEVTLADDGSAWVYGGDDNRPWLWVSRDRGRTWREVPLPGTAAIEVGGRGPLVDHGRVVYVVEEHPQRRVWRTVDDGAHWIRLAGDLPKATADVGLGSVVCFDGSLLVYEPERGALFSAQPDDDRLRPAGDGLIWRRAGSRYVRVSGRDPDTAAYHLSADGLTWAELRL